MPGWEPCQVEWWEDIVASLRKAGAWTDSAIRMDLRVLFSRRGPAAWPPTRGELASRWGLNSSGRPFRHYLEIAGSPESWQDTRKPNKKKGDPVPLPVPLVVNTARSKARVNPAPTGGTTGRQPAGQPSTEVECAKVAQPDNPPDNPAPTGGTTGCQPDPLARNRARSSTLTRSTLTGGNPPPAPPGAGAGPGDRSQLDDLVSELGNLVGEPALPSRRELGRIRASVEEHGRDAVIEAARVVAAGGGGAFSPEVLVRVRRAWAWARPENVARLVASGVHGAAPAPPWDGDPDLTRWDFAHDNDALLGDVPAEDELARLEAFADRYSLPPPRVVTFLRSRQTPQLQATA